MLTEEANGTEYLHYPQWIKILLVICLYYAPDLKFLQTSQRGNKEHLKKQINSRLRIFTVFA